MGEVKHEGTRIRDRDERDLLAPITVTPNPVDGRGTGERCLAGTPSGSLVETASAAPSSRSKQVSRCRVRMGGMAGPYAFGRERVGRRSDL
jgi:hypothetical protein